MAKARSLTVYLVKRNESDPHALIKVNPEIRPYPVISPTGRNWFLFVQRSDPRPPRWADFFASQINPGVFGLTGSVSAVLLVPGEGFWWALTFGQGRRLLHDDLFTEGFGLRVVLNSLGDGTLKSIDKETFDMIAGHARQQASREVGTEEFGLDIERDLLWAVTGSPRDPTLGQQLTGRDALVISAHIALNDLEEFLPRLYPIYLDTRYREKFAWIDNICEVDSDERQLLDMELVERLRRKDFEQTWLAPPEVLEWSSVRYFSYSEAYRSAERFDIHWSTFFEEKIPNPSDLSEDLLKNRRIFCVGDDGITLHDWPVYRCIYAEIDYSDTSYFLSGGKWYRITKLFIDQ
ncbi:MAG TPA: TIGR04141 family sporadically distributed protein, partial [Thermoanaerobaculia bacterium]